VVVESADFFPPFFLFFFPSRRFSFPMAALVLVSGGPASGKTATARAVAEALRDSGTSVVVVSEEGDPAVLYAGELENGIGRVFFFLLLLLFRSFDHRRPIDPLRPKSHPCCSLFSISLRQTLPRRSRPAAPSVRASTAPWPPRDPRPRSS